LSRRSLLRASRAAAAAFLSAAPLSLVRLGFACGLPRERAPRRARPAAAVEEEDEEEEEEEEEEDALFLSPASSASAATAAATPDAALADAATA
jgi:hypothetical protein